MIEKLPSGNYRAKAFYKDENGKKRVKSFTAATKKEAMFMAQEFQHKHQRLSSKANWSLDKAVETYLDMNDTVFSPSTLRGYNTIRRCHIEAIKNTRLCDLDEYVMQRWMNDLAKTKSPKTCKNAYGLVNAVLRQFYPDGVSHIHLPQKQVLEVIIPQKEDIQKLLEESKETDMYPVILLGAHMGLRRSEIAALTWNDIDLTNKQIRINKAKVRGDYGFQVKQPKTVSGTRTLDMTEAIYEYFRNADRTKPPITVSPEHMTKRFHKLCQKLNLPFHQHLLRHYFASVCAAQGLPESYAAMLMGHSSYDMIHKVYGHILDEEEKRARKKVTDYLNR